MFFQGESVRPSCMLLVKVCIKSVSKTIHPEAESWLYPSSKEEELKREGESSE